MENAQKAIIIGVGIFITIIIIAAVMLISGMGQDLINNSETEVGNISSNLQAQITANFDEKNMTGAQVIAAVKTYYKYDNLAVGVQMKFTKSYITCADRPGCVPWDLIKNSGVEILYYSNMSANIDRKTVLNDKNVLKVNNKVTSIGKMNDKTDKAAYIRTDEKFKSHLIKNNGTVVGIYFERLENL